jgi:hypothetical protein
MYRINQNQEVPAYRWHMLFGIPAKNIRSLYEGLYGAQTFLIEGSDTLQFNRTELKDHYEPSFVGHDDPLSIKECIEYVKNKITENYGDKVSEFGEYITKETSYGHLLVCQTFKYLPTDERWVRQFQYNLKELKPEEVYTKDGIVHVSVLGHPLKFTFKHKSEKNGHILRKLQKAKTLFDQIKYLSWQVNEQKLERI